MDAIEKRARERARFDAWVKASGSYSWNGFNRMEDMWDAWQAALAPPDGYVLVPVEVRDLYDFMAITFTPFTGQHQQIKIQLELARKAMLAARPEVKP